MEKFKWCVIGAGGIADRRGIPALLLSSNNEIAAVMDASEAAVKRVAEKYGVEKWFMVMRICNKLNIDPAELLECNVSV